ncbi:MAG: hypothetical protein AAFX40_00805 [Cyanobacteria bacterium J06639_1]
MTDLKGYLAVVRSSIDPDTLPPAVLAYLEANAQVVDAHAETLGRISNELKEIRGEISELRGEMKGPTLSDNRIATIATSLAIGTAIAVRSLTGGLLLRLTGTV